MITPIIIQVLFWICVAFDVISGLVLIVRGAASEYPGGGSGIEVLLGLASIILGPVFHRVLFEIIILAFRINETLTEIRRNTERPVSLQ